MCCCSKQKSLEIDDSDRMLVRVLYRMKVLQNTGVGRFLLESNET